MPIVFKRAITEAATVAAWRVTESEEELRALVTDSDAAFVSRYGNEKRRLEALAWRALLREVMPRGEIKYNDVGAPYVEGWSKRISVSHTDDVSVLLISTKRCAVDIERIDRDYSRVEVRFVSPIEKLLFQGAPGCKAAIWSAKEAMYKYSGEKELDLIRDMKITSVDFTNCHFTGWVAGEKVEISVLHNERYIMAMIL